MGKTYKATGTERYLTIGNFNQNHGVGLSLNKGGIGTYIYVDAVSIKLDVKKKETANKIILPNVITANNDNVNDVLTFNLLGNDFVSLKIVNRWGNVVFESYDSSSSFTGKNNFEEELEEGIYFYILEIRNYQTQQVIKKQSYIHLLR